MEKNTQTFFSNYIRNSLRDIPDTLFDRDPNQSVKIELLKKQIEKKPKDLVLLIKRMLNETK